MEVGHTPNFAQVKFGSAEFHSLATICGRRHFSPKKWIFERGAQKKMKNGFHIWIQHEKIGLYANFQPLVTIFAQHP